MNGVGLLAGAMGKSVRLRKCPGGTVLGRMECVRLGNERAARDRYRFTRGGSFRTVEESL